MWIALKFREYSDRCLLGLVSPSNAEIYFDAESVADAIRLRNPSDRRFLRRQGIKLSFLMDGHSLLGGSVPRWILDKKMLSVQKTAILLALFPQTVEMAEIVVDGFRRASTYSLADDWHHHLSDFDLFSDPEGAVAVDVYSFRDGCPTVHRVLKEIIGMFLEAYDVIANDENDPSAMNR